MERWRKTVAGDGEGPCAPEFYFDPADGICLPEAPVVPIQPATPAGPSCSIGLYSRSAAGTPGQHTYLEVMDSAGLDYGLAGTTAVLEGDPLQTRPNPPFKNPLGNWGNLRGYIETSPPYIGASPCLKSGSCAGVILPRPKAGPALRWQSSPNPPHGAGGRPTMRLARPFPGTSLAC